MQEFTGITRPPVDAGYVAGTARLFAKEKLLAGLPYLFVLPDVHIMSGDGVLRPGGFFDTLAFIPKGYFSQFYAKELSPQFYRLSDEIIDQMYGEFATDAKKQMSKFVDLNPSIKKEKCSEEQNPYGVIYPEEEPEFIKFMFRQRHFSLRSKVAQSGLDLVPGFIPNSSWINMPYGVDKDGNYAFPVRLRNQNPLNSYRLPQEPSFAAFRFYVPGAPIVGRELVEAASRLGLEDIYLESARCKRMSLAEARQLDCASGFLRGNMPDHFVRVGTPILREARYACEEEINLAELFSIPHRERDLIDQTLGLDWSDEDNALSYKAAGVYISETANVIFPPNIAGVIDRDLRVDRGDLRHIDSPFFDPGFGSHFSDGLPMRLERNIASPDKDPMDITFQLYYCKV